MALKLKKRPTRAQKMAREWVDKTFADTPGMKPLKDKAAREISQLLVDYHKEMLRESKAMGGAG